jgi:hypothetical protein
VSGPGLSRIAAGGAVASLGITTVLQAVDGIALTVMLDTWMVAPAAQKEIAFLGVFAFRQVEIRLASMASLSFGLTVSVYGIALLVDHTYPKSLDGLAIVGGGLQWWQVS